MGKTPEAELLRANQAFYDAFSGRDIEAMDELWAHGTPVACVHPGWPPLHGRDDVMSSWRAILLSGQSPRVRCERAHAVALGASGFVTCLERVDGGTLVATNTFALEDGVWQIVHHHAGPLTTLDGDSSDEHALN
jgi:ketosteroid isomerase-like protein